MQIRIDKTSSIPVYKQIRDQIQALIIKGQLPPGYRLPPERKLADSLGVNRTTVLNAYRDLRADGLIGSHIGQGTFVNPPMSAPPVSFPEADSSLPWQQFLSQSAIRMQQPLVSNILKSANRPNIISFAAGCSAQALGPLDDLAETQKRILANHGGTALQYSATEGHLSLRESLCRLMGNRGISAIPDEMMILAGSQQGIDLTARILLDPGDIVIMEEPTFFGAIQIFQSAGARIISVPIDEEGMRVDLLEPLLARYQPKLIYTVPTFQNPSGAVLSLERRMRLLSLAYQYQIPVLEDDPYAELRYDDDPVPPLKSLDRNGYVIYLSSFSKVLFPGLRVGWLVAPRPLLRQYILVKQMADLHTNSLAQWIFDDLLSSGVYARQVQAVREANRSHRDQMAEALHQYARTDLEWNIPTGGLYCWCHLPESLEATQVASRAEAAGIVFVPGPVFFPCGGGENFIRLSFSSVPMEQILPGTHQLMQVIRGMLKETGKSAGPVLEIRQIL